MKVLVTPLTAAEHPVVGRFFKSAGETFYCDSYDPRIGYWMSCLDSDARRNVSERAIGRTFHEVYLRPPVKVGQIYEHEGRQVWIESIKYFWRYEGQPAGGASIVGSYKEHRCSRGQWPIVDFVRKARLLKEPHHYRAPHPVRALMDAIRILGARHREAAYYLSLQLDAQYTEEEFKAGSGELFDNIQLPGAVSPGATPYEEALHLYAGTQTGGQPPAWLPPMTLPQREQVIIDAVHDAEGGLSYADLEHMTDQELARAALGAMWDYVRSQIG